MSNFAGDIGEVAAQLSRAGMVLGVGVALFAAWPYAERLLPDFTSEEED